WFFRAGGATIGVPLALGALGFTAAGIAVGSVAAGMMSTTAVASGGGVAAGSLVAIGQSVGTALLNNQPLRMPAIDVGETSGENASGTWPHSPKDIQQPQTKDCYIHRRNNIFLLKDEFTPLLINNKCSLVLGLFHIHKLSPLLIYN
uniref:Interferon alpha inducible protein 27 like 1 n=1 Tax=Anolis carolinensis TaxID=28377 RepID=A0A803SY98_ANOCA